MLPGLEGFNDNTKAMKSYLIYILLRYELNVFQKCTPVHFAWELLKEKRQV